MHRATFLVSWSLALLGCAGASPASRPGDRNDGGDATRAPLEIHLIATPGGTLREDQIGAFQLEVVVRNRQATTVDPMLDRSVLKVDGAPWKDWARTIGDGPGEQRWSALPADGALHFAYPLRGTLFHGPGRYSIVFETAGAASSPLVVQITPR